MLVTWLKFIVTKSFSWFFMIRKRRLCHKLNPMCFLWTLILQRTYENVLKDGLTLLHITACYCQSFLFVFYSPSKMYWSLTIEYMVVLPHYSYASVAWVLPHSPFILKAGVQIPVENFYFSEKRSMRLASSWMKYLYFSFKNVD